MQEFSFILSGERKCGDNVTVNKNFVKYFFPVEAVFY